MDSKAYQEWVTQHPQGSRTAPLTQVRSQRVPIGGQPSILPYLTMGLAGEAGEVADVVKKAMRDGGDLTDNRRTDLILELGDALWYLVGVADAIGLSLEDVMTRNYDKIEARRADSGR